MESTHHCEKIPIFAPVEWQLGISICNQKLQNSSWMKSVFFCWFVFYRSRVNFQCQLAWYIILSVILWTSNAKPSQNQHMMHDTLLSLTHNNKYRSWVWNLKYLTAQSLANLVEGHRHASKCFLIKVQPSILRVGAIKGKDWPNYMYLLITLSWNRREALSLCRHTEHSSWISPTHTLTPFPLWLLITKTRLWCDVN